MQLLYGAADVPAHHTAPFALAEVPEGFDEVEMPTFTMYFLFGGQTFDKPAVADGAVGCKWASGGEMAMLRSLIICGGLEFEPVDELTDEAIKAMNVNPLKDELKARNELTTGKKAELQERLKAAAAQAGRVREFKARKLTDSSRARLLARAPKQLLGL